MSYASARLCETHEKRAETIFRLRRDGLSQRQIMERLNWTRNEVNGVITRAKRNGLWAAFERKAGQRG